MGSLIKKRRQAPKAPQTQPLKEAVKTEKKSDKKPNKQLKLSIPGSEVDSKKVSKPGHKSGKPVIEKPQTPPPVIEPNEQEQKPVAPTADDSKKEGVEFLGVSIPKSLTKNVLDEMQEKGWSKSKVITERLKKTMFVKA